MTKTEKEYVEEYVERLEKELDELRKQTGTANNEMTTIGKSAKEVLNEIFINKYRELEGIKLLLKTIPWDSLTRHEEENLIAFFQGGDR